MIKTKILILFFELGSSTIFLAGLRDILWNVFFSLLLEKFKKAFLLLFFLTKMLSDSPGMANIIFKVLKF